jgi:hypothetical protein
MNKWQRYRLKDLKEYQRKKREYARTPEQRRIRTEYMRKWRAENREKHNRLARESHARNKHKHVERNRSHYLMKKYGITTLQKLMMVGNQNGRCGICQEELIFTRATHVDHCHKSGKIRGILCHSCNTKLGWYERLSLKIVDYLKNDTGIISVPING